MANYYIGVDLGGTNIKISVFDKAFRKTGEKRTPTEVKFDPNMS